MDQNNKNKKPGNGKNNARGVASLISWALVLTILISYAGNYFTSAGHQAATVELYYSDMLDMAESGQLAEVAFDPNESIMHLTPAAGYTYTGEDGILYTKTEKGWTYEKDGALWLKTAEIMRAQLLRAGKKEKDIEKLELKDDVLRRANGFYTYFAADIAYHRNKFAVRGYDKVINI